MPNSTNSINTVTFQMNWTNAIGDLALIWTIGLFSCGIQICYKVYKKGSLGEISALPFLSAFFKYKILLYIDSVRSPF